MRFHDFPELVLGSKAKLKVLLYFLSEDTPTSEREVSRIVGVSHTAVNKAIKDFQEANLVTPMRVGNVHVWKLNRDSYAFQAVKDLGYMARAPPLKELQDKLQIFYNYPDVKSVIVFGSIAESRETPGSDIDLFILINRDVKKNILQIVSKLGDEFIRRYGNMLSARIHTVEEFKKLNKNLVENINKGIKVI